MFVHEEEEHQAQFDEEHEALGEDEVDMGHGVGSKKQVLSGGAQHVSVSSSKNTSKKRTSGTNIIAPKLGIFIVYNS